MAYEYTPEEIAAELQARENQGDSTGGLPPVGNMQSAADLVSGFPERVGSALKGRYEEAKGAVNRYLQGQQTGPETALQVVGKGVAGSAADVMGETVSTAVGAAADMYDPKLRQGFNDLMKNITDSEPARQAIEYYMSLDDRARANIESIFNISAVLAPWKTRMVSKATKTDPMAAAMVIESKPVALKKRMLKRLLSPPRDAATIDFELKNGTKYLDEMVDDIADIKGFSPIKNPTSNMAALTKHFDKLENRLQDELGKFDSEWKMPNAKKAFGQTLSDTIQNSPNMRVKGLEGNAKQNLYASIMRKYDGVAKNLKEQGIDPNSLKGLLATRRAFDKQILKDIEKAVDAGGSAQLAAEKQAIMDMRKALNDVINGFVDQSPNAGESVKDLLKKQSSVLKAEGNYSRKLQLTDQDLQNRNFVSQALQAHPILAYRAMTQSGKAPLYAAVLAAPEALNAGLEGFGAARRVMAQPRVPLVRSGMFYGGEEEQQ